MFLLKKRSLYTNRNWKSEQTFSIIVSWTIAINIEILNFSEIVVDISYKTVESEFLKWPETRFIKANKIQHRLIKIRFDKKSIKLWKSAGTDKHQVTTWKIICQDYFRKLSRNNIVTKEEQFYFWINSRTLFSHSTLFLLKIC